MSDKSKTIFYPIYGLANEYQKELSYSAMSAFRFLSRNQTDINFVLLTDEKNQRNDLPLQNIVIDATDLRAWQLDGRFNFAIKVHAMEYMLARFGGQVVMLDTDTIFEQHPLELFKLIAPGNTILHLDEGPLSENQYSEGWEKVCETFGGSVNGYNLDLSTHMMNSGIVGIDAEDKNLLNDILNLMVKVFEVSSMPTSEQLSYSIILQANTNVRTCEQYVTHYWGASRPHILYQISQLYPENSEERFWEITNQLPKLAPFPPKRLKTLLKSRFLSYIRGGDQNYGFAWLAYQSAIDQQSNSEIANLWAEIAVAMLNYSVIRARPETWKDFKKLRPEHLPKIEWMKDDVRLSWSDFWKRFETETYS